MEVSYVASDRIPILHSISAQEGMPEKGKKENEWILEHAESSFLELRKIFLIPVSRSRRSETEIMTMLETGRLASSAKKLRVVREFAIRWRYGEC